MRSSRSRRQRRVAAAGVGVLLVCVAATAVLFVWPSADRPRSVDAVVVFAGGRGERLALAEQLMRANVAENLVIPNGRDSTWPDGNRACTEERPYEVYCPIPRPDTTRGEARTIAALAESYSWNEVLVVTSTYHLSRAGLLLSRCHGGEVLTVGAAPDLGGFPWLRRVVHEWLAWTQAVLIDRRC